MSFQGRYRGLLCKNCMTDGQKEKNQQKIQNQKIFPGAQVALGAATLLWEQELGGGQIPLPPTIFRWVLQARAPQFSPTTKL